MLPFEWVFGVLLFGRVLVYFSICYCILLEFLELVEKND